jgi:hypothetical protein
MSGIVDIEQISKSSPILAIDAAAATTTSSPIDARGKNAALLKITIADATQNWTVKLQGCFTRNGTYVDLYEQANTGSMVAMSHQTNASKIILFKGIPDWIKVVATEDVDGAKCSVEVQLINV